MGEVDQTSSESRHDGEFWCPFLGLQWGSFDLAGGENGTCAVEFGVQMVKLW